MKKNEDVVLIFDEINHATISDLRKLLSALSLRISKRDSAYVYLYHKYCERGKEINRLQDSLHEKNVLIDNLIKERGRIARELSAEKAVHAVDLQATKSAESALIYKEKEYEQSLKEKDEVLDVLCEELSHSKSREEELLATIKDYMKELSELRKRLRKVSKKDVDLPY